MNCKTPVLFTLLIALVAASGTHAQSSKISGTLATRAANGPVRVIVTLATATQPEVALDAGGVLRQRASIAAAQSRVIDALAYAESVTRFETVAAIALTTDANGLARLATDSNVASIRAEQVYLASTEAAADADLSVGVGVRELGVTTDLINADNLWTNGNHGFTWNVAVLGFGVERHSFFTGRITTEACYGTTSGLHVLYPNTYSTSLCPSGAQSSTAPQSALPCPDLGCERTTRVAGVAIGSNEVFSGVAPRAGLIPIKVATRFNGAICGSGSASCVGVTEGDAVIALERVMALAQPGNIGKIAAVHFPTLGPLADVPCDATNVFFKPAVDAVRNMGIPTIIGSGENSSTTQLSQPSCVSSVITVGASSKSDQFQGFSNRTVRSSLVGPGQSISTSTVGGGYGEFTGTDLAAAHVAGAWALLKTIFPGVSVDAAVQAFRRTGVPLFDSTTTFFFPRIVVDKAAGSLGPAGSPTEVVATAVGTNATIAWNLPFDGSLPAAYHVEFTPYDNGAVLLGVIRAEGTARNLVTTLPSGRYLVRVRALNAAGVRGVASNDVRLIVGLPPISDPPLPPSGFRAQVDGQTVSLYWNSPTDSSPATAYLIDASSIPNFTTNFGTFDTNSSEQTMTFRNVQPGTYFARVRAKNGFGSSGPSNEISVSVIGTGCGVVPSPTALNATVVNRLVTLNWNPPVLPGAILGYVVEAGTSPGASNVLAASIPNQTAVASDNVAQGTYYVRVRARSANCGITPPSAEVVVVVP